MLVWALYGKRLDGRDPTTGRPPAGSGVPVDDYGLDHPDIWPKVADHLSYITAMPEAEKRLIARWIDIGAPKTNIADDMQRPVVTMRLAGVGPECISANSDAEGRLQRELTVRREGGDADKNNSEACASTRHGLTLQVGFWDDSPLDWPRAKVAIDGKTLWTGIQVQGNPAMVEIPLPHDFSDTSVVTVEVWDKPDRSLSLMEPGVAAANRMRVTLTGAELQREVQ
jgi:hypothetical protein